MSLQKQVISIPFKAGVDTKTDPKQIIAPKLAVLQNGLFQSTSRIIKRGGNTQLATSAYLGNANGSAQVAYTLSKNYGINSFKSELTLLDRKLFFTFDKTNQQWYAKGWFDACNLAVKNVQSSVGFYSAPDLAYSPLGLQCFIYFGPYIGGSTTLQTLSFTLVDYARGAIIESGIVTNTALSARIEYLAGAFWIVYLDQATSSIKYFTISDTSPNNGFASSGTIATASGAILDTTVIAGNMYVFYQNNGSSNTAARTVTPAGVVSAATIVKGAVCTRGAVFGDASNNAWFSYYSGTTWSVVTYNQTLSAVVNAELTLATGVSSLNLITGIIVPAGTFDNSYAVICAEYNSAVNVQAVSLDGHSYAGVAVLAKNVKLLAKTYVNDINIYIPVFFLSATPANSTLPGQNTNFVLRLESSIFNATPYFNAPSLAVAKFAAGTAASITTSFATSNRTIGGVVALPFVETLEALYIAGSASSQGGISSLEMSHGVTPTTATMADTLHLTGGQVWAYDGLSVSEQNFHLFPEPPAVTNSGLGGFMAAGSYLYYATWAWTDNSGVTHYSAPSAPIPVTTTGSTSSVTLVFASLAVTSKPYGTVQLVIWRSAVNATNNLFYRASSPAQGFYTSSTFVSLTDTSSDAQLASNPQLYTRGGTVINGAPPASIALCTYKSRLISIPSDSRLEFWYSKQVIPGTPVEFSPFFTEAVDSQGGDLTACQQLDDKLILTKQSNIFYLVGQGPTPNGDSNDFSQAQLIATDSGCNNARSLVLMPNGVMYLGMKGIYLLNRALEDQYIGADVENAGFTSVSASILLPDDNQVRFLANNGTCLMYDYLFGQWSIFTGYTGVDCCIFETNFTQAFSIGTVWEELPGVYADAGAQIALTLETAWFSFAQLQGFQRVYKMAILGEYKSQHTLMVQISYDFEASPSQVDMITLSAPITPYQFRIFMNRQKGEAIKVKLSDFQLPAYGEGFNISALAFEVGTKGGVKRLPAGQSYG